MYGIRFVDDDELPKGHDFLFVDLPDGAMIFYRASAVTPETLEDSWAAFRALGGPRGDTPSQAVPPLTPVNYMTMTSAVKILATA